MRQCALGLEWAVHCDVALHSEQVGRSSVPAVHPGSMQYQGCRARK